MVKASQKLALPAPEALRLKAQSLAVLDAIMSPDWQYRYYSFNSKWSDGEMMVSMTDSCGDNFFILFNWHGAILKGFDHESFMSPWAREDQPLWPGLFEGVPPEFHEFLKEPAFDIQNTTFCMWRKHTDNAWQVGPIEYPEGDEGGDGSEQLLSIFIGGPESYKQFALEYYEKDPSLELLRCVYRHEMLTEELIRGLNPEISFADLKHDLDEIGYPSVSGGRN
ncbi:MAG TPA: hypothetical protein VN025_20135 [Candidatus Dormibacteraeota bacterium]|jgi:hypothetical protein|nr:hypothetical protein [Candidatus Dormibacteraeota bacterium]